MKGNAAEREALQTSLGRRENISATVADAESYVLMLLILKILRPVFRMSIGRFFMQ